MDEINNGSKVLLIVIRTYSSVRSSLANLNSKKELLGSPSNHFTTVSLRPILLNRSIIPEFDSKITGKNIKL